MNKLTTYLDGVAILEDYNSVYADRGHKRGEAVSTLAEYEATEMTAQEIIDLKDRYDKVVKDWAKDRAEVFSETNSVFQKVCADCKSGKSAKLAQAAYGKQLKWKEEAEAEVIALKERCAVLERELIIANILVRDYARTIFNADDFPCEQGYDCPEKDECQDNCVDCVGAIVEYLKQQAQAALDKAKGE